MLKNKKLLIGIFAILLLITMSVVVNAATVDATETTKTSTGVNVKWSYELEGENIKNLKCTNVAAITGNLTIPTTIDGHKVTSLGSSSFSGAAGLKSVIIPVGTTTIGNNAFYNCTGLTSVTIPSGVTSIGSSAFYKCTGLTSITIPNTVTSIGSYAFEYCSGLKSVTLSNNLTKLTNATFENCTGLTEIVLPDNLTTIDYWAFYGCTNLKSVKMPENIVSIDTKAFVNCNNLTIYGVEGSTAQTFAENNNINFENITNWDKRNEIAGSDITAPTVVSMYIPYSDVLGYWNKTTNDHRIPRGVEIPITVKFSEVISGTTPPTLTIKCGQGDNIKLKGTITGEKIVYTYTIKENDEGLITVVSLNGGNIKDAAGNAAVLSVKELKVEFGTYAYANGSVAASSTTNSSSNTNNSSTSNSSNSSSSKSTNTAATSKDNTVATKVLPYTGKVILIWSIAIVAASGIVAHIRYKRLYIK